MIQNCPVILTNEYVTVVRFGDQNIQFPSIHDNRRFVRVAFNNDKYRIVDDLYEETNQPQSNVRKNRKNKKTTIEEVASQDNLVEDKMGCDDCKIDL